MPTLMNLPAFIDAIKFAAPYAHSRYSIVACDVEARTCGLVLQTNNLTMDSRL